MPGLVPFNRKMSDLMGTGFGDIYNMLDDYLTEVPMRRLLAMETFKVDVAEDEQNYSITAELPGVKKEEINVSMEEGRLQISVMREEKEEEKSKNYIHKERRVESMERNIFLSDADPESVKAKLEEGILMVNVAKKKMEEKSKKIQVE